MRRVNKVVFEVDENGSFNCGAWVEDVDESYVTGSALAGVDTGRNERKWIELPKHFERRLIALINDVNIELNK